MLQSLILLAMLDFFLSTLAFFCVYHSRAQVVNALTILAGIVMFGTALFMLVKGRPPENYLHQIIQVLIACRTFSLLLFETHWQQKAPTRRPQKSPARHF